MLYHLLFPLREHFGALNVVQYITFRIAAATLTALFISFIVGPWLISTTVAGAPKLSSVCSIISTCSRICVSPTSCSLPGSNKFSILGNVQL